MTILETSVLKRIFTSPMTADRAFEELGKAGYRVTQPRKAVIKAILEQNGYLSPAEVYSQARRHHPGIGLVTVYRTLDLLTQIGLVRRIHTDEGCHRFASASHGHRHHLVCRHCGAAVEFEGCDLSPFLAKLGHQTGYLIEDHLLELLGACTPCQRERAADPRQASDLKERP